MLRSLLVLILIWCPHQIFSYNTNRGVVYIKNGHQQPDCDYYESPVFKILPKFVQSRNGDIHEVKPVVFVENRMDGPQIYGNNPYALKYFANISPATVADLDVRGENYEEEKMPINYDQLWKVGEIPTPEVPTRAVIQALPDIFVKSEDLSSSHGLVEKSELTEESQHMGQMEIGETFLSDPSTQMQEVIIETIMSTENPAITRLKQNDAGKAPKKSKKHHKKSNKIAKDHERKADVTITSSTTEKSQLDPDENSTQKSIPL